MILLNKLKINIHYENNKWRNNYLYQGDDTLTFKKKYLFEIYYINIFIF